MGIGFLVPAFLAGLALIAVPVILHLLNKERKDIVRFPSLMFVERIPYRSIRRQTIRHPLLLALRCLGIILLAAAFARPFLERVREPGAGAGSAREVVLLVDRSYSMGVAGRWERAQAAVEREIAGLSPSDRASVVAFDERAVSLAGPTADAALLRAALDTLRPGHRATRIGTALAAARQVLAASEYPRREVVLVSDLQRSAWDGRDEGRLPSNVAVRVVDLADTAAVNTMVAGIELARDEGAGGRVAVVARVVARGGPPRTVPVALALEGREIETKQVALGAGGAGVARFTPVALPSGTTRATVRVAADALAEDDVYHFIVSRDQALRVLIVTASDAPRRRSLYLQRALALGDQPPYAPELQTQGSLGNVDFDRYAVVVLNDVPFPGGAAGRRLEASVRSGVGLIAVLGDRSDPRRWPAEGTALLPATAAPMVDRTSDNGGHIGTIDRAHPIFAPFVAARTGDFSSARFLRYRPLTLRDSAEALANFDDGTVALAEGKAGRGTVLAWSSTLDDFWNDLPLQAVYLPFVHRMVRHAAAYIPEAPSRTVGQLVRLEVADSTAHITTVLTPAGRRDRRAPGDPPALELAEPGVYGLLTEDGTPARLVAANADRAESDLSSWDATELAATLVSDDTMGVAAAAGLSAEERERRARVWWFLLIAAAAVLLLEAALANRMSRQRGTAVPVAG